MKPHAKYFFLKGKRDYIHSVEIFSSIISSLNKEKLENIDFSLSKKIKNQWFYSKKKSACDKNIAGLFKLNGVKYYIYETNTVIHKRLQKDEKEIIANCDVKGNQIAVIGVCDAHTFIEKSVAAFKELLKRSVFPYQESKYVFMRIVVDYVPVEELLIQYSRTFGGKFIEGIIICNHEPVGKIYFLNER